MLKVKHDFVTNSSSSSFIVAFPKLPETPFELQQMMFGDDEIYRGEKTIDIANYVWRDLIRHEGKTEFDHAYDFSCDGYLNPDISDFLDHDKKEVDWDGYFAMIKDEVLGNQHSDFRDKHPDAVVREFSYSDECGGLQSFCEHEEIFHNLPYERESHH